MLVSVKAVALDQYCTTFFHRTFYHRADLLVENRVTNGLMTGQFSEVRGYSMTRVQGEEFTLTNAIRLSVNSMPGMFGSAPLNCFIDISFAEKFLPSLPADR